MAEDEHLDQFDFEVKTKGPRDDIRAKYREVFASPLGRKVLEDILENAEFGSMLHPDNDVKFIWHNLATLILRECGMIGPGQMDQVVTGFCNVFPKKEGS